MKYSEIAGQQKQAYSWNEYWRDYKTGVRTTGEALKDYIGKPVAKGVGKVVDQVTGKFSDKIRREAEKTSESAAKAGVRAARNELDKTIGDYAGYIAPSLIGAGGVGLLTHYLANQYNKDKEEEDKLPAGMLATLAALGGGAAGAYTWHNMRKGASCGTNKQPLSYTDLAKQTKQAYFTQNSDWNKYTTPEERKTLDQFVYKLQDIANDHDASALLGRGLRAIPSALAAPGVLIAAAAMPSYTLDDIAAMNEDKNFKDKYNWIPGYGEYKALKAQAAIDRVYKAVRERREAAERKKAEKSK